MGFFSDFFGTFFSSRGSDSDIKYGQNKNDGDVHSANRFTKTGNGTHVHESYTVNRSTGEYKEYRGGENSSERSYNKK